MYFVARRQEQT